MNSDTNNLDARVKKLEENYTREVANMLKILEAIETRFLGSLDNDAPGLLADIRELKRQYAETTKKLCELELEIEKLEEVKQERAKLARDSEEMQRQMK